MQKTYKRTVFVDAGLIWVGDPCYTVGKDTSHTPENWKEFCDKLDFDTKGPTIQEPLGHGIGVAISSGFGDGEYEVTITTSDEAGWGERVQTVLIDFRDKPEEEDNEWPEDESDYWNMGEDKDEDL